MTAIQYREMTMATAKNQQNWRKNTHNRRVEVYLPETLVGALDQITTSHAFRGRADTIKRLLQRAIDDLPEVTPENIPQQEDAQAEPETKAQTSAIPKEQIRLARHFEQASAYVELQQLKADDQPTLRAAIHSHEQPAELIDQARERLVLIGQEGDKWKRIYAVRHWMAKRIGSGWSEWVFSPKSYRFIAPPVWYAMVDRDLPEDAETLHRLIRENDPVNRPGADVGLYEMALKKAQGLKGKRGMSSLPWQK
jgi:hypothetical protein